MCIRDRDLASLIARNASAIGDDVLADSISAETLDDTARTWSINGMDGRFAIERVVPTRVDGE